MKTLFILLLLTASASAQTSGGIAQSGHFNGLRTFAASPTNDNIKTLNAPPTNDVMPHLKQAPFSDVRCGRIGCTWGRR